MKKWFACSSAFFVLLSGCTTAQREAAGSGAVMGLVGGVTAAAVDALLFGGGNTAEHIVKAGFSGAAAGAAVGVTGAAISESGQKSDGKSSSAGSGDESAEIGKLRKKVGDINFQAGILWVQCEHREAIQAAERAFESTTDKKQQLYALLIQAAASLEFGEKETAEALYPRMVELDNKRDLDSVKADTMEAMLRIQKVRREQGLPACR